MHCLFREFLRPRFPKFLIASRRQGDFDSFQPRLEAELICLREFSDPSTSAVVDYQSCIDQQTKVGSPADGDGRAR